MKPRGQLIIDEFEGLRSFAGKSGLDPDPEILQGDPHLRKRNLLFKKLKLDPKNEDHVAYLCSIVYDHLYLSKKSAAVTKYGDDKDYDLLERIVRFANSSRFTRLSDLCRNFIKKDKALNSEYGNDGSTIRFRRRLERAAKKAINGKMNLTAKREARLKAILPALKTIFER